MNYFEQNMLKIKKSAGSKAVLQTLWVYEMKKTAKRAVNQKSEPI